MMFTRSGTAMAIRTDGDDETGSAAPPTSGKADGSPDDEAHVVTLEDLLTEDPDPEIRLAARELAQRLRLRRPLPDTMTRRGGPRRLRRPFDGDTDDIDLDATIDVLVERQRDVRTFADIEDDDVVVVQRRSIRRAVALVVDISGSMKGEKAKIVGAVVGALAAELRHDDLSIVAFWKDCALLTEPGRPVDPLAALDDLLRLPRKGLTNVHVGLAAAAAHLHRSQARERFAILLSDCVHNAGPDPRLAAAALPRLDVLLETDGEHDLWLARELAATGRGRLATVETHRDVAGALTRLFAER